MRDVCTAHTLPRCRAAAIPVVHRELRHGGGRGGGPARGRGPRQGRTRETGWREEGPPAQERGAGRWQRRRWRWAAVAGLQGFAAAAGHRRRAPRRSDLRKSTSGARLGVGRMDSGGEGVARGVRARQPTTTVVQGPLPRLETAQRANNRKYDTRFPVPGLHNYIT